MKCPECDAHAEWIDHDRKPYSYNPIAGAYKCCKCGYKFAIYHNGICTGFGTYP